MSALRLMLLLILTALLSGWVSVAMGVAPSAGTQIENIANSNYIGSDNKLRALNSNRVIAKVGSTADLTLVPDNFVNVAPGQVVTLPHTLTNLGNDVTLVSGNLINATTDDYDLNALALFYDSNDNGVIDTTDIELTLNTQLPAIRVRANVARPTLSVPSGGRIPLLIQATVPVNVPIGSTARLEITIADKTGVVQVSNVDSLTVTSGSALLLTKSASAADVLRNEVIDYSMRLTNNGLGSAGPVAVTIDGVAQNKLIIRDQIPANTTFEVHGATASQLALYHRYGDPLHQYTTVPPADYRDIDVVAIAIDSLPSRSTVAFDFSVRVHSNASGDVKNVARVHYTDGGVVTSQEAQSNQVITSVNLVPPTIRYYQDANFGSVTDRALLGQPLYVASDAASCNESPVVVEKKTLIITSTMTGDEESFIATETGPNTGIFRIVPVDAPDYVPTQDADKVGGAIIGNAIMETLRNDTLTAKIEGCGSNVVETRILVDPTGVVYDTCFNVPVPGTRVQLVDAISGQPAQVFELDAITVAPNDVIVGADGVYLFPLVNPGSYRLLITPPVGFNFPSTVPVANQPAGRILNLPGSFGGSFPVNINTGAVVADIPVDCTPVGSIFLKKSVSDSTAEVGNSVGYTLEVKNTGANPLDNLTIEDQLPLGFSYMRGTAKVDGLALADPVGAEGADLLFNVPGTLAVGTTTKVTYRVRVGSAALRGDGINSALARAQELGPPVRDKLSNAASVKVAVTPGIFSDESYLHGKVYTDCNRNRIQDPEELGIPGVRLYLDDGTYAITDVEGKYSLYGLRPRTHVIKVDPITLPPEAELITLDNRHAGDPNSRFVDLRKGELHRADFAEGSCNVELISQVKLRRTKGEIDVHEYYLNQELPLDPTLPQQSRVQDLPSQGIINGSAIPAYEELLPSAALNEINSHLPPAPQIVPVIHTESFEELLPHASIEPGFLDLKEGDHLGGRKATIRVKGMAGARFRLLVNGEEVDEEQIGNRSTQPSRRLQAWEYVGVELLSGRNNLEFQQLDSWGNVRGGQTISIYAPGEATGFVIDRSAAEAVADGNTPVNLRIRLVDADGSLVSMRLPITLESELGRWNIEDLNPSEPGIQQFLEKGMLLVSLLPPQEPGEDHLRITSGKMSHSEKLIYNPNMREMIAVGIVEGMVRFDRLLPGALVQPVMNDGFEQELMRYSWESDNGETRAGARTSLFLKGKVKGDYLLTMAYDSDKETQSRLFRDIRPEEFYPVYGDSSIRGFDAQSTSPLYLRVEKDRTYLMYGDYTTHIFSEARKLGNYQRSLTGLRLHHEDEGVMVDGFVSQDTTRQIVEEIRGQGISGPYRLSNTDLVLNSEQVEIIVRDRYQPSIVLETRRMQRFTDYQLDGMSGGILFRQPVASVDERLNPISIRVSYEVEQGGDDYIVAGVVAQKHLGDHLEVGGSYIEDQNSQQSYNLRSANATIRFTELNHLVAEVAESDQQGTGVGQAKRVELIHKGEGSDLRIYASEVETDFVNPGASLAAGRREAGVKGGYQLSDSVHLSGEVISSEDLTIGGVRKGANLQVESRIADSLTWMVGARYANETVAPAQLASAGTTPIDQTSIQTSLNWRLPMLPEMSVYAEYEQATDDANKKMAALGAEYQFSPRGRVYARHELISSLNDSYGLNNRNSLVTSVIGLRNDYMENGTLFSEYRARDAFEGRETEAAIGLRNRWPMSDGLSFDTGFERVQPLDGNRNNLTTAITGAVNYTANPLWKGTARLELRTANNSDSLLNTLGVARKLNRDWSLLGKNHYFLQRLAGGDLTRDRLQIGLAYRDTDTNIWNGFSKYEIRSEDDEATNFRRLAHIVSLHANRSISDSMYISGRYATKWVNERFADGYEGDYTAQLVSARYIWDFTERWDLNLNVATLASGSDKSVEYGLGAELGYLITANLWISGGYNLFGYQDDELSGEGYTQRGAYLRLRFKFDETLFDGGR